MRKHLLVSISSVLVWSAFPLLAAGESFEVIVLRGSEVVKVIGDSGGAVSEVTLRKAPTLPAMPSAEEAQPKVDPPDELVVVVNQILPTVFGVGPVLVHRSPSRCPSHSVRGGSTGGGSGLDKRAEFAISCLKEIGLARARLRLDAPPGGTPARTAGAATATQARHAADEEA